jgi:hypothetical protein
MERTEKMKYILYVRCSYCDKDMGTKDAGGNAKMHGKTSHSICPECFSREFPELAKKSA